jgi:DNA-binding response OmpR family regulator
MQKKILIVDQTVEMADALKNWLSEADYSVINTNTAKRAWQLIKKEKPQLILIDLKLPDISGIDLGKKLKNNRNTMNIPLILMSADHLEHSFRKDHKEFSYSFLEKPIQKKELLSKINYFFLFHEDQTFPEYFPIPKAPGSTPPVSKEKTKKELKIENELNEILKLSKKK